MISSISNDFGSSLNSEVSLKIMKILKNCEKSAIIEIFLPSNIAWNHTFFVRFWNKMKKSENCENTIENH